MLQQSVLTRVLWLLHKTVPSNKWQLQNDASRPALIHGWSLTSYKIMSSALNTPSDYHYSTYFLYENIWTKKLWTYLMHLLPMLLNNTNIKTLKSHQSVGISIREGIKLKLSGNILSYIHTLSRPQWVGWAQCTKHSNTLWDFLILLSQCPAALLLWEGIRKDWLNGCSSYVQVWGPVFILKKHSRFKLCGFYSQSLFPHFLF